MESKCLSFVRVVVLVISICPIHQFLRENRNKKVTNDIIDPLFFQKFFFLPILVGIFLCVPLITKIKSFNFVI